MRNPETIAELFALYRSRGCRARYFYQDGAGHVGIRGAARPGFILWHNFIPGYGFELCGSTLNPGRGTSRYPAPKSNG